MKGQGEGRGTDAKHQCRMCSLPTFDLRRQAELLDHRFRNLGVLAVVGAVDSAFTIEKVDVVLDLGQGFLNVHNVVHQILARLVEGCLEVVLDGSKVSLVADRPGVRIRIGCHLGFQSEVKGSVLCATQVLGDETACHVSKLLPHELHHALTRLDLVGCEGVRSDIVAQVAMGLLLLRAAQGGMSSWNRLVFDVHLGERR